MFRNYIIIFPFLSTVNSILWYDNKEDGELLIAINNNVVFVFRYTHIYLCMPF